MRTVLLGSIAAIIISAHSANAATAYDAMRVVGKEKSESLLEKITEVRGLHGSPQPSTWKISTKETSYDIRGAKLTSTSAGRALTPLNLSELKLDSDGAHTVAEREAKKAAFSYDYADYTLRSGAQSTPVWEVRLVDEGHEKIAILSIGADTGKVLASEGLKKNATPPKPPIAEKPKQQPAYVKDDPANYDPADEPKAQPRRIPAPQQRRDDEESADPGIPNPGYERAIDTVASHLKLRGRQLHSWFDRNVRPGGRPTYSPNRTTNDEREEPRQPERRPSKSDPNETRYYKPAPGERLRD